MGITNGGVHGSAPVSPSPEVPVRHVRKTAAAETSHVQEAEPARAVRRDEESPEHKSTRPGLAPPKKRSQNSMACPQLAVRKAAGKTLKPLGAVHGLPAPRRYRPKAQHNECGHGLVTTGAPELQLNEVPARDGNPSSEVSPSTRTIDSEQGRGARGG